MTYEDYTRYWDKVDKTPLDKPIEWKCQHCAYPGVITRRCDVPGFCPYCGAKLPYVQITALERERDEQIRKADQRAFAAWWNRRTQEVVQ